MAVLVTGRPGMQVLGSSWDNWPPVATSSFYVQETPVHAGQSGAVSPERLLLTGSAVGIWEGCFFTVRGCPLRCRLLHPLNATPPPHCPLLLRGASTCCQMACRGGRTTPSKLRTTGHCTLTAEVLLTPTQGTSLLKSDVKGSGSGCLKQRKALLFQCELGHQRILRFKGGNDDIDDGDER